VKALESLLKDLEEKANAATPGPWDHEAERYSAKNVIGIKGRDDRWIAHFQPEFNGFNNAEFLAAANPDTIKKLIAVIRELQQACKINWPSEDTIKQYCLTESTESALRITRFFLWLQKYVESERK
jgi:hypothetical protein